MEFLRSVSVYAASIVLGLSVAAPIGPINVEIIRRGLTQGSRAAFAMGCGAVSADCIYFGLALIGTGLVSRVSDSSALRIIGLGVGSAMLTGLGMDAIRRVRSIRATPPGMRDHAVEPGSDGANHPLAIYGLGLGLTLSNPMTIALWLSIAAGFAAGGSTPGTPLIRLAGFLRERSAGCVL